MVGLLDIAPVTEKVTVRGGDLTVVAVEISGIAHLLSRFPEIRMMFTGRTVTEADLLSMAGPAARAIIAAGTGHMGDEAYEKAASNLTLDEQADVLRAIFRLTAPNGIGPLVEKLGGILDGGVQLPKAPATKSRKRQTG